MRRSATLLLALWAGVAKAAIPPAGCDTDWRQQPITHGFDYATDIQPVWNQFCANCHVAHGGAPLAGLDLDPPFSYTNIVDTPDAGLTILLVAPGNPADSLLWRKVNCNEPGPQVNDQRMPLGRPPLPFEQQALLYDWIAAGAPFSLDRVMGSGMEER